MLGDRVCRFAVLLLQAHRQLFLIYVKMFIIPLNCFAWWSLKHVTPACSEWQAKLRSWIFGEELMSENILLVGVCKAWTVSGVCSVCRAFDRGGRWIFITTFEYFLCFCWAFVLFNLASSYHPFTMLLSKAVLTICAWKVFNLCTYEPLSVTAIYYIYIW